MSSWNCQFCNVANTPVDAFCGECGKPPAVAVSTAHSPSTVPSRSAPTLAPTVESVSKSAPPPVVHDRAVALTVSSPTGAASVKSGPIVDTATPENLARYEALLRDYAADGVLEGWELESLERQRASWGISHATHDRLLVGMKLKTEAPLRVGLALDELTIREFVAGQHGVVHWRVDNFDKAEPVRNLRVLHGVDGKSGLDQHAIRTLKPDGREDFRLQHFLDTPGQFLLSAAVECESVNGEQFHFRSETVQFRVGAGSNGAATNVLNIEAKSSVVDLQGILKQTEAGGGIVARDAWRPVKLTMMSRADFDLWVEKMEGKAAAISKSQPPLAPSPKAEAAVWKGEMKAVRFEGGAPALGAPVVRTLRIELGSAATEVVVATKNAVSFGRDPRIADILLAVEPFDPPETFADNILKTRRFSGQHLSLAVSGTTAEFTHLGRSLTTYRGDAVVQGTIPLATTPIELVLGRDVQLPQGALTIRLRSTLDPHGATSGVVMERVSNVPERRYVLVRGLVPLTSVLPALEAVPGGGGLYLGVKDEQAFIVNAGHTPFPTSVGVLTNLSATVLAPGLTLNGVGWKLAVDV